MSWYLCRYKGKVPPLLKVCLCLKCNLAPLGHLSTYGFTFMQSKLQTRYSDQELEEFQSIIEGKLSDARQQLDFYLQQLAEQTNSEDGKVRGLDDGTTTMANEDTHNLANRQRKLVQHLENALLRIENKVYGVCRVTGKLISKERLRIVPHTTLSIHAKQNR